MTEKILQKLRNDLVKIKPPPIEGEISDGEILGFAMGILVNPMMRIGSVLQIDGPFDWPIPHHAIYMNKKSTTQIIYVIHHEHIPDEILWSPYGLSIEKIAEWEEAQT